MAKEVSLKVPQVLYDMIEELAKKERQKPIDYLSDIIRENYKK